MKLYLVTGSKGSWDDFSWFIIGVYADPQKADEAKRRFVDHIQMLLQANPCPVSEEDQKKIDSDSDLDGEIEDAYDNWRWGTVRDLIEYNMDSFRVEEIEANQMIEPLPEINK
jgi:hypothetical protein